MIKNKTHLYISTAAYLIFGPLPSALAQSTAQPIDMSTAASAPTKSRMDKEVTSVMSLWPGNYDNREQVQIDTDMGRKALGQGAHVRIHSVVRRIDAPQVGAHVLYVEDYKDNDTQAIVRHGVYVLATDNEGKSVKALTYSFKDPAQWRGAGDQPARLQALTRADIVEHAGCDITLRRDGDAFVGGTNPSTCMIDKKQSLDFQLRLMNEQMWQRERTLEIKTGKPASEVANFAWHHLERARFFSCMIDPPRSMVKPGQDGPGQKGYVVRIHDQGGTFTFTHADGRSIFLSLRNTWSYNMNRKTLVVTLQENNENGSGLGYAWAQPGADRLGMNPLWIHIQCDLDTPENREMQRSMRNVL